MVLYWNILHIFWFGSASALQIRRIQLSSHFVFSSPLQLWTFVGSHQALRGHPYHPSLNVVKYNRHAKKNELVRTLIASYTIHSFATKKTKNHFFPYSFSCKSWNPELAINAQSNWIFYMELLLCKVSDITGLYNPWRRCEPTKFRNWED